MSEWTKAAAGLRTRCYQIAILSTIDLDNYQAERPCSVAIGIFDGVHLGHRMVLSQTRKAAEDAGLRALALTFEPHPAAVLAPERTPLSLCSFSQKVEWMSGPGLVESVVVGRFDRKFADLSPREFVEQMLVQRLRVSQVRVGADFRFGHRRSGSVMHLESLGEQYGFTVSTVHAVSRGGERISSSVIRKLVAAGRVAEASELLGRPFTLRGDVISGKGLGREIGFPTANLQPEDTRPILPSNGVYAGYARIGEGDEIRAAISVGTNPTTDGDDAIRKVEAFLMDGFEGDLYGSTIDLQFVGRIRDEQRFGSVDDLVAQMKRDTESAAALVSPVQ